MISRADAEHDRGGIDCDGWHLHANRELDVIQERVPPSRCETRHVDERARQFLYLLTDIEVLPEGLTSFATCFRKQSTSS